MAGSWTRASAHFYLLTLTNRVSCRVAESRAAATILLAQQSYCCCDDSESEAVRNSYSHLARKP
jgi:hypothetical protein